MNKYKNNNTERMQTIIFLGLRFKQFILLRFYKQKEKLAKKTYTIQNFIQDYKPYFNKIYKNCREGRNLIPTICSYLMARTLHTQAHRINKNIDNFDLIYVIRITW